MAVAVQANLAQLRTTQAKRMGIAPTAHDIQTPSPGAVHGYRETLIDWKALKGYSDADLALRLREIWGQFCLFCWAVHEADPHRPPAFATLSRRDGFYLRCGRELLEKAHDIERTLWRLQFEQRLRHDPAFRQEPGFEGAQRAAAELSITVFGEDVRVCSAESLLMCSCEYVGMLHAVRWIADDRADWNDPALLQIGEAGPA